MKHSDPQFWNFALAYLMVTGGSLAITLELFISEAPDRVGLIMILMGIFMLRTINRISTKPPIY